MARGRKISAESKVKAQYRHVPEVTILLLFLLRQSQLLDDVSEFCASARFCSRCGLRLIVTSDLLHPFVIEHASACRGRGY